MALVRHDWYQSESYVTVDIFAKNIDKTSLIVDISDSQVIVKFSAPASGDYERVFKLFETVDRTGCRFDLTAHKLEMQLKKSRPAQWNSLERNSQLSEDAQSKASQYPSSARIKHDWSQLDREAAASGEEPSTPDDFFKKLYANASEETRRAMMKSFIESSGTVLSTNWDEVGDKTVEPAPPEGVKYEKK